MQLYDNPYFTAPPDKEKSVRCKWFIDVGVPPNLHKPDGSTLGSEYILFVEDSPPRNDGVGEVYLLEANCALCYAPFDEYTYYEEPANAYKTTPGPITDPAIADYEFDGLNVYMKVKLSALGLSSPNIVSLWWATCQENQNLEQGPGTDSADSADAPFTSGQLETATGTGTAFFEASAGTIENLGQVPEGSVPCSGAGKPNIQFPHGFFEFDITGLTPGEEVIITITLPSPVVAGAQYWKCHDGTWIDVTSILGDNDGDNILTLTITDGGLGDDDHSANGVIDDQGGPGIPPAEQCFIATAAYGTYLDPQVQILRQFRDEYLLTNPVGERLVSLYYEYSPPVADFIDGHPDLKPVIRAALLPAVVISTVAVNTAYMSILAVIGLLGLGFIAFIILRRRKYYSSVRRG